MDRTQVAIIGGGPAGMLLAHALDKMGIASIVIERSSKAHVLSRIRAGVLEQGTVKFLRDVGLGERMDTEGMIERGTMIGWEGKPSFRIELEKHTGKPMMAFGQTAITEELYIAQQMAGRMIYTEASDVIIDGIETRPIIRFRQAGKDHQIACDIVAGCDGFHGVSRQAIPRSKRREWERVYPFGWLGIMAEVPPLKELVYTQHSDGFALASKRNSMLSRFYVQCPNSDKVEDWSDDRFWEALINRLPDEFANQIVTGPSIEKSIAPLRSFVSAPMQYGKLFLAGDAAHIVPPTGAKGLNLAVSDVYYLSRALDRYFNHSKTGLIERYSETALNRVWSAVSLSWRLTKMLHRFDHEDPFDEMIRQNDYDMLMKYEEKQVVLAREYCGLPY